MNNQSVVFAIYRSEPNMDEVLDRLKAVGVGRDAVGVLTSDNVRSRELAEDKGMKKYLSLSGNSLDGTTGFLRPAEGPRGGALPSVLTEMGVPPEWCDRRVVHGDYLIAAECEESSREQVVQILKETGASDIDSALLPRPSVQQTENHEHRRGENDIGSRNR